MMHQIRTILSFVAIGIVLFSCSQKTITMPDLESLKDSSLKVEQVSAKIDKVIKLNEPSLILPLLDSYTWLCFPELHNTELNEEMLNKKIAIYDNAFRKITKVNFPDEKSPMLMMGHVSRWLVENKINTREEIDKLSDKYFK